MVITVYNISATSARVHWPSSPSCRDTFYSVMYDPNWNSLIMGYKRKSFMHEERIPVSQTSTYLGNLIPKTMYFLCVTCQAANPDRDQCQVFTTMSDSGEAHERGGWEVAMGIWMASSILLLVIAGVLLWGCLHNVCSLPGQNPQGCAVPQAMAHPDVPGPGCLYASNGGNDDDAKQATVIQNPLFASQAIGHIITQDHELRTFTKLSGSEPV